MQTLRLPLICLLLSVLQPLLSPALFAAPEADATGRIEGRVYLPSADRYLENALVRVEGTNFTTFTDAIGVYQFANVPAGTVKITASFSGFPPRTTTTTVRPGETTQADINIMQTAPRSGMTEDEVVKLERFVVNADRYETGAALARNEQRFSVDMRTVVSADEFGENPSGNIGELMKHLPGVSIVSSNGEPRAISIDGVSADHVPITFDGFSLANASSGSSGTRQVELEGVAMSSMSRIEIRFSPTPEAEGRALAGSVNFVPRSAFEYSKPRFAVKTYMIFDADNMTLNKTPGPWFSPTRKTGPSVEFSYTNPVNKQFGFTVAGNRSIYSNAKEFQRTYWRGSSDSAGIAHFPLTDVNNPYLSRIDLEQGCSLNERIGFSFTADWRITAHDRLSVAFQYGYQDIKFNNRTLIVAIQDFDASNPGILSPYYSEGGGYVRQNQMARRKTNTTYMPTITWRHNGPVWKINVGLAYSHATSHYNDIPYGFFYSANADRGNVKVIFDQMQYDGPRGITITDLGGTNAPIDPYSLDDLSITNVYSRGNDAHEKITNGYADVSRSFMLGSSSLFVKAGYNYKQLTRERDNISSLDWIYLGADGKASGPGNDTTTGIMNPPASSDDGAKIFLDESFSTTSVGFGHPNIEWVDLSELYQMYDINPGYFQSQDNSDNITLLYKVTETINSAYLRSDLYLFGNRLQIVGGVRMERTDIEGQGPLRTNIGGRMQWVAYGAQSDVSYTHWFPRVNLTWEITPGRTLLARAAYFESIGRPRWDQYVGQLTMPDRSSGGSNTSNRFGMKNAEIEPWTSKTFSAGLEYYFARNGSLSARVYNREIDKFFITTVEPVSSALLESYGLDPLEYDGYYISTQKNSSEPATVKGLTFDYKQSLTFLPKWARGVSVYANATFQTMSGPGQENLVDANGAYRPRMYKAGITYARKKFSARFSWRHFGRTKVGINTSTNVPDGTYTYLVESDYFDASFEYRLGKYTFYCTLENITGEPQRNTEIYGPNTPKIARLRYMEDFAARYTFGVKAVF
ncbi:iron complex outermembrane receptor protein [Ereboglobus sp. PH5-5]|uniref:TonB-dependent receptor n=1 Tax=Ereboglobus sp. PH5-5 TaxID=2940529 RepID=UPI002406B6B5|nr:TonB-dependent receptor [Ereboglobus sp. PH5-5]MDF9834328.1 iron complex outermembrane receptor protein [Ereboglobus sp. PH5-5]